MALKVAHMISKHNSVFNAKRFYSKPSDCMPKNILENLVTAQHQKEIGSVYDKKPFKVSLEAGKPYFWCTCGKGHKQPFCDGTHKNPELKITLKPLKFAVEESKEYWLCNCKHTKNKPFCDGTHKSQVVQDKNSVIRQ